MYLVYPCQNNKLVCTILEQWITRQTYTYDEYLFECFVDEYQRDKCNKDFLHKACEVAHEKSTLKHHYYDRKHSNPHADPQAKHQKLHVKCITHLHNIQHYNLLSKEISTVFHTKGFSLTTLSSSTCCTEHSCLHQLLPNTAIVHFPMLYRWR